MGHILISMVIIIIAVFLFFVFYSKWYIQSCFFIGGPVLTCVYMHTIYMPVCMCLVYFTGDCNLHFLFSYCKKDQTFHGRSTSVETALQLLRWVLIFL